MGDAAGGAQAEFLVQGGPHQLVGVEAPLHNRLRVGGAAQGDASRSGFALALGFLNFEAGNIDTDLGSKRLHLGRGPDEYGLDEAMRSSFDRAQHGDVGERPDNGGGDGRQVFAAGNEFMENVIVGRVADQWVDRDSVDERV